MPTSSNPDRTSWARPVSQDYGDPPPGEVIGDKPNHLISQRVIDTGVDLNERIDGELPLFVAMTSTDGDVIGRCKLLLAQPSIRVDVNDRHWRSIECAVTEKPALLAAIRTEVSQHLLSPTTSRHVSV